MSRNWRRLSASRLSSKKPGAATTLAANQVANARPDGYTLVVLTSIALSINPTLYKHLNYDAHDLTPISLYVKSPFVLWSIRSRTPDAWAPAVSRRGDGGRIHIEDLALLGYDPKRLNRLMAWIYRLAILRQDTGKVVSCALASRRK
jgi:hypothetical protein